MKRVYIAGVLVTVLLCSLLAYINRPFDNSITIDGIKAGIENHSVLAKVGNRYYETTASPDFAAEFQFESWKPVSSSPAGEPVLTLQLSELWVVSFYDGGFAGAHNGYSAIGNKSSAFYNVGETAADQIVSYLIQHGIPHEVGDGTISAATFNY